MLWVLISTNNICFDGQIRKISTIFVEKKKCLIRNYVAYNVLKRLRVYSNGHTLLIKMAAMSIYGKNHIKNLVFSEPRKH